jgi:hypothetical protein
MPVSGVVANAVAVDWRGSIAATRVTGAAAQTPPAHTPNIALMTQRRLPNTANALPHSQMPARTAFWRAASESDFARTRLKFRESQE